MNRDDRAGHASLRTAGGRRRLILRELPYLAILLLTLGGIGYATMTRSALEGYWVFVAAFNCAASILAGWPNASHRTERWRLLWTQLLHWGAFLAVMGLVFLPSVQSVADSDSTSLLVMLLLALGTFVAGVHTMSWRMSLNGIIMALFVPAVAWLDQSALILSLIGVVVVLVATGGILWFRTRTPGAAKYA